MNGRTSLSARFNVQTASSHFWVRIKLIDWLIICSSCRYVGQMIGWVSSALYLGSRVAQIYKSWSRQSAEGLSIAMFVCAITANVLYGMGILLRTYKWSDLASSGPWLLGSLGTVFLDIIIYSQVCHPQHGYLDMRDGNLFTICLCRFAPWLLTKWRIVNTWWHLFKLALKDINKKDKAWPTLTRQFLANWPCYTTSSLLQILRRGPNQIYLILAHRSVWPAKASGTVLLKSTVVLQFSWYKVKDASQQEAAGLLSEEPRG